MTLLACLCAGAGALAGCGSGGDGTIPPEESEALVKRLEALDDKLLAGECEDAQLEAAEVARIVEQDLPEDVDPEVRDALEEASANLTELTESQCVERGTTDTDTDEPQTSTTETTEPTTTEKTTTTTETEEQPSGGNGGGNTGGGGGNAGGGNTGGGGNAGGGGQPDVDIDPPQPEPPSGGIGGERNRP